MNTVAVPISATLALMACSFGSVCQAHEPADVEQQVSQLEHSWSTDSAEKQYEYFVRAGEIASSLFREERKAAELAATTLLNNLLDKHARSPQVGATDLIARAKVARFVLDNPVANDEAARDAQIKALKALVIQVRSELQRNYSPKPVYVNLPPKGKVRENQENNLNNSRQAQLRSMDEEFSKGFLEQVKREAVRKGELMAGR